MFDAYEPNKKEFGNTSILHVITIKLLLPFMTPVGVLILVSVVHVINSIVSTLQRATLVS